MGRSVRFIHAADLHMGSPLRVLASNSPSIKTRLDNAIYRTVERVTTAALEYDVDFVLLCGDIYDRKSRSVQANKFLTEQLVRLSEEGIPVFIVYGNHDPLTEDMVELPEGVTVFAADEVKEYTVHIDGRPAARVMGQSYRNSSESRKIYRNYNPSDEDLLNVGLLHTGLDADVGRYVPCSPTDLTGREKIHYWALGHRHTISIIREQIPYIAYPGIPQGRHVREEGPGGCLLVEASPGETPEVKFVPTSEIIWMSHRVAIDELSGPPENLTQLRELLRREADAIINSDMEALLRDLPVETASDISLNPSFVIRWIITGRGEIHSVLAERGLQESSDVLAEWLRDDFGYGEKFLWTESVQMQTAPLLPDIEKLVAQDPVLKELSRIMKIAEDDEVFRKQLRQACGEVWQSMSTREEQDPESLALTEDRLDEMIHAAYETVLDRILRERGDHVD